MSPTRPPRQKAPPLTCDCHFHIFGPYDKYPLSAGRTYDPPPALVPDAATRQRVLVDNPAKLYGF
jgi:predicted TIM-barrel fold metal-dependent hydrolase